ncbi:MAG: hypothetical protein OXF65_06720 [Acidimicrobiaceae bacterium]|nr:hypothetical protein [Acidimicrobiaceae bacterium]
MNSTAVILVLALGVPALLCAVSRIGPLRRVASNSAGIALQTVIIIVVMLLIAGGVSAVLLSRGQEAMTDLQVASLGGINASNCTRTQHTIDDNGTPRTSNPGKLHNNRCVWEWPTSGTNKLSASSVVTTPKCKLIADGAVKMGATCELPLT